MIYTARYTSFLGELLLAAEDDALVGLWLEGQKYFPDLGQMPLEERDGHPVLRRAGDWLDRYFAGERPEPSEIKLNPAGSRFRRAVWEVLCRIPYGETATYGQVAEQVAARLGEPRTSARAVGGAVGHNPISIIIPCHRVVGADGSLTGYAGGIPRKIKLLAHEGVELGKLSIPGGHGQQGIGRFEADENR